MSWDDYQPQSNSRCFSAKDLPADRSPIYLTIEKPCREEIGDDGEKPCLLLSGHEERDLVVLNHERFDQLREAFPDANSPEELRGRKIGLKRGRTKYKGKRVDCVELVPCDEKDSPAEFVMQANGDADSDEEVPF